MRGVLSTKGVKVRRTPEDRLAILRPCKHHKFYNHRKCEGPVLVVVIEYDNPLATVDIEFYGEEAGQVSISSDMVINAALSALNAKEGTTE